MSYPEYPQFTEVTKYYDELMRGVPYKQWVDYLERIFERLEWKPQRILDLACGTGNVSELLAKCGYIVVGVDISEGMVAEARRKAAKHRLSLEYHIQDAAELTLNGELFDLCVCLFDSINYILDPHALQRAFNRVYQHMVPGGYFMFDINSEYALINNFFDQHNMDTDERLRYVWRSEYSPQNRLCTVRMRFFLRTENGVDEEFRETHLQYAYREDELKEMLSLAGFETVATWHAYTFRPVKPTTDRIYFCSRRPRNTL